MTTKGDRRLLLLLILVFVSFIYLQMMRARELDERLAMQNAIYMELNRSRDQGLNTVVDAETARPFQYIPHDETENIP